MKGLLAEQKAVLAFQNDPDGPDRMWKVRVESKDVKETHEKLLKLGIENHTLVDHGTHHEVYIFDQGGEIADKVQSFQMKGGHHVEGVRGSGEFIGSWTSREEGASKYREVLSAFASNGQAHRDAVKQFHQLRRRWLSERVENRSQGQDQSQTQAIGRFVGNTVALTPNRRDRQIGLTDQSSVTLRLNDTDMVDVPHRWDSF